MINLLKEYFWGRRNVFRLLLVLVLFTVCFLPPFNLIYSPLLETIYKFFGTEGAAFASHYFLFFVIASFLLKICLLLLVFKIFPAFLRVDQALPKRKIIFKLLLALLVSVTYFVALFLLGFLDFGLGEFLHSLNKFYMFYEFCITFLLHSWWIMPATVLFAWFLTIRSKAQV